MGRVEKNLNGSWTVYRDDGTRETFTRRLSGNGWTGDAGSTIDNKILGDGFVVRRRNGQNETWTKDLIGTGWHGDKGSHVDKGIFDKTTYKGTVAGPSSSSSPASDAAGTFGFIMAMGLCATLSLVPFMAAKGAALPCALLAVGGIVGGRMAKKAIGDLAAVAWAEALSATAIRTLYDTIVPGSEGTGILYMIMLAMSALILAAISNLLVSRDEDVSILYIPASLALIFFLIFKNEGVVNFMLGAEFLVAIGLSIAGVVKEKS